MSAWNVTQIRLTQDHSVRLSRRFKIAGPSWPRDNYAYIQPNESESEYYQRRACLYPEAQRNYGTNNWAGEGSQWVSSYYDGQTFYAQQKRSEGKFDIICTILHSFIRIRQEFFWFALSLYFLDYTAEFVDVMLYKANFWNL